MTLDAVLKIIAGGTAEAYLDRFIKNTLLAHEGTMIGGESLDGVAVDAFVAAECLALVLDEPDVRRVLNLKRLPRGKAFDPFELAVLSRGQAMRTALRFHLGLIDKPEALNELANAAEDAYGKQPKDDKTIESMLMELTEEIAKDVAAGLTLAAFDEQINKLMEGQDDK